jgi:hypothetical protein
LPTHPLHQAIGSILDRVHQSLPDDRRRACFVIKDPACVSGPSPYYVRVPQNIPLFCSMFKSNATVHCNVDPLILLGGGIKVIVEIEESSLDPTHVFGKFLTSASALCYIHDADGAAPIVKDERVLFVQVMDTSSLKPQSTKRDQWNNIQSSIRSLLPLGSISEYHLIHGDENDFMPGQPLAEHFAECVTNVWVAARVADGPGQHVAEG